MSKEEKWEVIADMLEMEPEELREDLALEELETWDSVAILSFIAYVNEKFDKFLHARDFKDIKTIGELAEMLEE
ncbi:MAG: acyl carrier protein [Lachnospiraceae bacterium]|nr:acyl carrier protein [Lachnospiraceae bacterium]